jgi:predicted ATP-grasp superfamily ATP-dependent carboligase
MPAADHSERPAVLLTNAEERSVLAACRSLSRAGYRVGAASHTALAPAQWSRSCDWRVRVPDPRRDASGFVEKLRDELARRPYAALIPGSDGALLAISRERERLPATAVIGLPPPVVVERALSRTAMSSAARAAGFAELATVRCSGVEDALAAARELGYPVALKSTDAALAHDGAVSGAAKGRLVRSEEELRREAPDFHGELLLQQFLAGEPVSLAGVVGGGELLALATTRYVRMWPPDGGSVAFGETIPAPPGLEEQVRDLLAALEWEGIFELELIHTHPTSPDTTPSHFVPIDLNPRPYGSMALANAAGAPLAAIWCDWLLGRGARGPHPTTRDPDPATPPVRARPGLRYRWEDGDLRHLASQLRRRRLGAALAAARPHRGVVHAHLQRRDPLPLLARIAYLAKRTVTS